ncbi:MAG: Arc family DNA-binding protein [Xanthomonadales bacterium]|nr:Arc family DNA-binding protein [Xanthomonadales bacterium]
MPNLSIKNVPGDIVARLHQRAAANHRSMQGELLALVTAAVDKFHNPAAETESRRLPHGHKPIEQIAAEHLERVKKPIKKGPRSVDMIRADRDAR